MMTATMLSSQQLAAPLLRFDYAIRTQTSPTAFEGFRDFGPYDKNQPRKATIRCAVLFPAWAAAEMSNLREAFLRGMHFFRGFQRFSHGISISSFDAIEINTSESMPLGYQARLYRDAIVGLGEKPEFDLIFVLIPFSPRYILDSPYYVSKSELAARGVPCQLLTVQKLKSDETFKWSLANIALQVYAKLGNVPWVVETADGPSDLIIGIGQRQVRRGRIGPAKRFMGFTTAYKNNGTFLTFQGIAGVGTDSDYCERLSKAISAALVAYRASQKRKGLPANDPDRVIFHSFKKVGSSEIEAVIQGIEEGSLNGELLAHAFVHIDGSNNFLLFDSNHRTALPASGYTVWLGPLQALLLTEGRERYDHRKIGYPSPLTVRLDGRSELGTADASREFPAIVSQVFALSKANWRGFNAAAVPVSLTYSRLIAELIASCQEPELWDRISEATNLRDKAWFL